MTSYNSSPRRAYSIGRRNRGTAVATLPNQYNQTPKNPFGAAMAQEIFDLYSYDDSDWYSDNDESPVQEDTDEVQLDLPLENLRELEERMRAQIKKFDRAYHKMMIYALQWHYLQEEVEESPQIKKMFQDMQMIRKLTGSDKV